MRDVHVRTRTYTVPSVHIHVYDASGRYTGMTCTWYDADRILSTYNNEHEFVVCSSTNATEQCTKKCDPGTWINSKNINCFIVIIIVTSAVITRIFVDKFGTVTRIGSISLSLFQLLAIKSNVSMISKNDKNISFETSRVHVLTAVTCND